MYEKDDVVLKKKDFGFIVAVLLISVILFFINNFKNNTPDTVLIYVNSALYKTLPLNKNTTFKINDTNTIEISDGSVYMRDADCPDKLCIKQGKIKNCCDGLCVYRGVG